MAEVTKGKNKPVSADWFVHGVLTKIGDIFDRITGRGWKPSSSLATSELIERLKALVDAEAREESGNRKYVPHNIALKMQWDKFSTDSEKALRTLETELLTALIDHINDRRYYTYAPISLTVKPDYFTNGVKLLSSFANAGEDEREVSLNVTVPDVKVEVPDAAELAAPENVVLTFRYEINGTRMEKVLELAPGSRISIGRTRENTLSLDDVSVSKMHAALVLKSGGELVLSDTGSTNGTFVDGKRIAYGKGIMLTTDQVLRFGSVEVRYELTPRGPDEMVSATDVGAAEEPAYQIGEFEFAAKRPAPSGPSEERPPVATAILQPLSIDGPPTGPESSSLPGDKESDT